MGGPLLVGTLTAPVPAKDKGEYNNGSIRGFSYDIYITTVELGYYVANVC